MRSTPFWSGEDEIRTRGKDCSLRRFSKPVVSATHPPLQCCLRVQSYIKFLVIPNFFKLFLKMEDVSEYKPGQIEGQIGVSSIASAHEAVEFRQLFAE